MLKSLFPSEFTNLPRECIERMWDKLVQVAQGVYLTHDEFNQVLGVADEEVKLFAEPTDGKNASDALYNLFKLFELPARAGWVDAIEVMSAVIMTSDQLSRREKHWLLRDRCMLFSSLNVASVINGASIACTDRRSLESDEQKQFAGKRDIDTWTDKFTHKKISIKVEVVRTTNDVVETNLKLTAAGQVVPFDKNGVAQVVAESGSEASIGGWKLRLRTGTHKLKGKTEADMAEVRVQEMDGLNREGDADESEEGDSQDVVSFRQQVHESGFKSEFARASPEECTGAEPTQLATLAPETIHATCFGMDNAIGAKQIASGEVVTVVGRFVVIEDLLNVKSSKGQKRIMTMHKDQLTALAVHPNGRWILSAQRNSHRILVWDWARLTAVSCIDGVVDAPTELCISKCGSTLFAASKRNDRAYAFYDLQKVEKPVMIFSGRLPANMRFSCADMLSKEEVCVAGDHVYRVGVDGSIARARWGKTAPKSTQSHIVAQYGSKAAVSLSEDALYLWEKDSCTKHVRAPQGMRFTSMCATANGNVAVGLSDGTLCLYNSRTLQRVTSQAGAAITTANSAQASNSDPRCRTALVSLHAGLSGILTSADNGSLFWHSPNDESWTLIKVGHGGNRNLLWSWCGSDMIATAGQDHQIRVWTVQPGDKSAHRLRMSFSGVSSNITAIAGDSQRVFVALEGRRIRALDIREPQRSSYDLLECTLPVIDRLAASENLVAACCIKASMVEVRAFPSGKLVAKLRFDASGVVLEDERLCFRTDQDGEPLLSFGGDVFLWDAKAWKPVQGGIQVVKPQAEQRYIPVASGSALVLLERHVPLVEAQEEYVTKQQVAPPYWKVGTIPSPTNGEPPAVVAVDGRGIRAFAVHPDEKLGLHALATDQPFVQVGKYKLRLDSPAQALAFDEQTHLAVCSASRIYLFDWKCGIQIACAPLACATSTTLSLAITPQESGELVARVNGFGDIQVWRQRQDKLEWDPALSVLGVNATCLTPAGYYGTAGGEIRNWAQPSDKPCEQHPGGITDLFQDRQGLLSSGRDGSVRAWTLQLQQIPLRKEDQVKYSTSVVSVYRVPVTGQILLRLKDGSVFLNGNQVPPHKLNVGISFAALAPFRYDVSPQQQDNVDVKVFRNSAKSKVLVSGDLAVVYGDAESKFAFDDPVKIVALSNDSKVLAVASQCNDLYVLDANTCLLIYFWPASALGCNVESLKFEKRSSSNTIKDNTKAQEDRPWQDSLFEDLFINEKRYVYRT